MITDIEDVEATFCAIEQAWPIEPGTELFGHSQWIKVEGLIQPCKETRGSLRGDPKQDLFGTAEDFLRLIPDPHHMQDSLVVRAEKRAEGQTPVQLIDRGNLAVEARLAPPDFHPVIGRKPPCHEGKGALLLL